MEKKKEFELGVYSFGNTPRNSDGSYASTAQAIRDALEAVKLAEDVGLDYFGFGEHHTHSMPISSPASMVVAAATATNTGGSPNSVYRAAELGVPMFLGILGGTPEKWATYGAIYRDAWVKAGHAANQADIGIAVHGFVAKDNQDAKKVYLQYEGQMFVTGSAEIGRPMAKPLGREADLEQGMVFAGSPENVAERIVELHKLLGHSRQILQMDVGGMPHRLFLKSIELLGTKVLPIVRKELDKI